MNKMRSSYFLKLFSNHLIAAAITTSSVMLTPVTHSQTKDSEPLFGTQTLSTGFSPDPILLELSPGGSFSASSLPGAECLGYINEAQPDLRISYEAGADPLSVFVNSSSDTTLLVNDPSGNWHCSDDSAFLSSTNPGVQISSPTSGDYNVWVGTYDMNAEPIYTVLAITEQNQSQWSSLDLGVEESILARSIDSDGNIDFGDDSGFFTLDDECDDPRFQGNGAVGGSELFSDATDCRTLYEAGSITLAEPGTMFDDDFAGVFSDPDLFSGDMAEITTESTTPPAMQAISSIFNAIRNVPGLSDEPEPTDNFFGTNPSELIEYTGDDDIEFGLNTSIYADDGECDDPRFEGPGMASFTEQENLMRDANDCIRLYMDGMLTYSEFGSGATATESMMVDSSGINFGDNSSIYQNDGECDDPRFQGPGMASFTEQENLMSDANDCRQAYQAGNVTLIPGAQSNSAMAALGGPVPQRQPAPINAPQVGREFTVPRGPIDGATRSDGSIFASGNVYGQPLTENSGLSSGISVPIAPPLSDLSGAGVNFGDNTSDWANDGECDDPRFEGIGMASVVFDDDAMRDANDCRKLYDAGSITLK